MGELYLNRVKSQRLIDEIGVSKENASLIKDEADFSQGLNNPQFTSYRQFSLFDLLGLLPDELKDEQTLEIIKVKFGDKWMWQAGYNMIYWTKPHVEMVDAVADLVEWYKTSDYINIF